MRDFTQFRLDQERFSLRERLDDIRDHPGPEKYDVTYIYNQFAYCMRLQETLKQQNAAMGQAFLKRLQEILLEQPLLPVLKNKFFGIRALLWYDACLIAIPYRAQGRDQEIDANIRVIQNWSDFLKVHPSWQNSCGTMVQQTVRKTLQSAEMHKLSARKKHAARKAIRRSLREMPDIRLVIGNQRDLRLFVRCGIDTVRVYALLRRIWRFAPQI